MPWRDLLLFAIQYNDRDQALDLLISGHSANAIRDHIISPLSLAVDQNNLFLCELLTYHKADVNWRNNDGQTAIYSCTNDDVDISILELLLRKGARTDVEDTFGGTPLHFAAHYGISNRVRLLLESPTVQVNAKDYFGCTALHYCIKNLCLEISDVINVVSALLGAGADMNITDGRGRTCLHLASIYSEHADLLRFLLSYPKPPNYRCKSKDGENFLHYLFDQSLLMQSFLMEMLQNCNIPGEDLKVVLNDRSKEGLTPFSFYLETALCNIEIVRQMIQLGADVNVPDFLGVTPLVRACDINYDIAQLLLDSGANVHATDIFGKGAIACAVDTKTAVLLLESGVSLSSTDRFGRSTLCQRLGMFNWSDEEDCNEYLMKNGADVNHRDKHGASLLHYAAYSADEDVISLLLENRADLAIKDNAGHTALDIAKLRRRESGILDALGHQAFSESDNLVNMPRMSLTESQEIRHDDVLKKESLKMQLAVTDKIRGVIEHILDRNVRDIPYAEENDKIGSSVIQLINTIGNKMGEIDKAFKVDVIRTGSSEEGTKAGDPNEFDFAFNLTYFESICNVIETTNCSESGLVQLRSKTTSPPREVAYFFDESCALSSKHVREVFAKYLKVILRDPSTWTSEEIEYGGPTPNFDKNSSDLPVVSFVLYWVGSVQKNLTISIDVAPAIKTRCWWPSGAAQDSRALMSPATRDEGCLLLAQTPYFERLQGNMFRASSSLAETSIMKHLPMCVKQSYMLAKSLAKDELCPVVHFSNNEDEQVMEPSGVDEVIKSYMLKNCLLNTMDTVDIQKVPSENTNHGEIMDFVFNLTVKIFQVLKFAASSKHLPGYLFPNQNIFTYRDVYIQGFPGDSEELTTFADTKCKEVHAYCTVILGCLGVFED